MQRQFPSIIVMLLVCCGLTWSADMSPVSASRPIPDQQITMGTIAYLAADSTQIRLIEADGSNDRLLWTVPNPSLQRISDLDWNPDGSRIAFASTHEAACSLYRSDIYTIRHDGSDLRRVTNGPACAGLAGFAKGSVTIEVENQLDLSLFLLYVEGASNAVEIVVNPLTRVQVTIDNIADFGAGVQQRIVIFNSAEDTWLAADVFADIVPNGIVNAGRFVISNGNSTRNYGAFSPSWHLNGQQILYALGEAGGYQIAADAPIGTHGVPLFGEQTVFARLVNASPIDNRHLFYSAPYISLGTAGLPQQITPILELSGSLYGLDWLSDGSGLVAGEVSGLGNTRANIFRYQFGADAIEPLTDFEDAYAADPSVAPDGSQIVFIYAPSFEADAELQIMNSDGSAVRALGVNGLAPDWGRTYTGPPEPSGAYKIFTPLIIK